MKILVTGGSGFIGSALVSKWLNEGHEITVFDNGIRGNTRRLRNIIDHINYIEGDVRDFEKLNKVSKGIDTIAHLAYINGTEYFYKMPDLILEIALKGLINTVDCAIQNKIENYWLMSSGEVYQTPLQIPTNESEMLKIPDPLNPRYSYGGGKIISELYAISFGRKFFKNVSIVRPHNVYGPDMGWQHVIPQFIQKASNLNKKESKGIFTIQGGGSQTRAFCYIDDFVDGCSKAFMHGEHLGIYHVGTNEEIQIIELARRIIKYLKFEAHFEAIDDPLGQTNRRCPDITKVSKLGYRPQIDLTEGLSRTIPWYIENQKLFEKL